MTATVELHVLLTGFQTDRLALAADGLDMAAIFAYLLAVRRLAGRRRYWPGQDTAAFVAGIVAIWIAVGSGLAAYDDTDVTVHVIQHALLMMIAAPLVASGRPVTLASQAAPRPVQVRLLRVVHSPVVADLTYPASGWFVYYASMYACFADRTVYTYLSDHPLVHDASHLLLLVVGLLYWQPLIGGDPSRWRLSPRARTVSMVAGTASECVLGVIMMDFHRPLDPVSSLGGTHLAGLTFLLLAVSTCGPIGVMMSRRPAHRDRKRVYRAASRPVGAELP